MPALKTYLVEDSALIRDSLVATLTELVPIELLGVAETEDEALRWLAAPHGPRGPPDLLIVDLFLREGSGLGVLQAPRSVAAPHRRIVLSNFATREIRLQCLLMGADRVFDKSNDIDELIAYCVWLRARLRGDPDARASGPVPLA